MTVLLDTGVLYADHDTDAARHGAASTALETVYDGEFGQPYISDYIFDEAVTLTRKRTGSQTGAQRLGNRLRGIDPYAHVFELVHLSRADFAEAVTVFDTYADHTLSFTDATSIALMDRYDIDRVLSFDDDFDGIVTRTDPTTV